MEEETSPESLEALYADLLALSESRLSSIERLGAQLDAHMQDFKNLLDKQAKNDKSRQSLATGKLSVAGVEYSINEEFQQGALRLADELGLDELDAARLFLEAQEEAESSGRPVFTSSLIRFHQRRKCLLDSLRLLVQQTADVDTEEALREDLRALVFRIIQPKEGGTQFTTRCLTSMAEIRGWIQLLADKATKASMMGQNQEDEDIEYQRVSLVRQHESLGIIVANLVKENNANNQNFTSIVDVLKKADKYDNLLVHQLVPLAACISKFGGIEAVGGVEEAKTLHERLLPVNEKAWALPYVQAAFRVLWLAEYSGCFDTSNVPEFQLEDEAKRRAKQFTEALKDGAFDFLLSVSADVKSVEWHDPARHGLRQWLQKKSPAILTDSVQFSGFLQDVLMEQLESFVEGFITNMPDALRKLRLEEDVQRQQSKDHEHDLDLEKFIVIISYTFENRPKAALLAFWDVPDGSMMGFVHWASKRASTPLVSAFCEMLQSISEDEECATAAHHFLLDEGTPSSGKMRRTQNLTWIIIFKELEFFMKRLNPAALQAQFRPGNPQVDFAETEPESVMMLECYLRLITRLASESETSRNFLGHHPSFQLGEMLFQLSSSAIGPRLRACAFTTLRALLSNKTREAGEYIWAALDVWITGGYSPGALMPKTQNTTATTTAASMSAILNGLSAGFEEPNAFVQLLHALVSPYADETGLHDELPFPEALGSAHRQPGIDTYVDFAIGQIFGRPVQELNDLEVVQRRLLQLSCLDFIATCLDTFNEDLIILASQANVSIDSAIRASSLQSYVMMHPFSRVMEWMFNPKIMAALFNTVNQDPAEVARVAPDSPLVLCLLRGIHVINAILELQPTYLDIIRPLIKELPSNRRVPLPSGAYGSFEEGILNHLKIFRDLGRYCGTGHPELVITSLKLLERMSSAPKLSAGAGRGSSRSRALAAMHEDADTISKILLQELESSIDINEGPESPAHIIKTHILDFLIACLRANPGQPSIAHLLLGFKCGRDSILVDPNSSFNRGVSLFHTILNIAVNSPIGDEMGVASWMVSLSFKSLQVLKELWSSPISSAITMAEMRLNEVFFSMFVKEVIIQPNMPWDGVEMSDPNFPSSTSVECVSEFLARRALTIQYLSAELRIVARGPSPSLKQKTLGTLMGTTTIEDDVKLDHATIFDMFDFMETELEDPPVPRRLTWFDELDIAACLDDPEDSSSTHNVVKLEELLVLRRSELTNAKRLENPQDLTLVNTQAQDLLQYVGQDNRVKTLNNVRLQVLKSWVQLVLVMIESGDLDEPSRILFVDRALQTIMPRLDANSEVILEATELAKLAKVLVFSLAFNSDIFKRGEMAEKVGDRLFALFQISLGAINTIGTRISLKEYYYNICFRYMAGMADNSAEGQRRRHSIQTIKAAGERFIDVICDDAQTGEPTCRISALLVLSALVKMGKSENSKYITDALSRLNFISSLVESIRKVPLDFRNTSAEDVDMQLLYIHAKLTVLLQICQSRVGAANVCGAGFFHNVKESGLFAIDPDLGVDIEGPGAIGKFYDLLGAVMRIMCAVVLSRGSQNQQTLEQGRKFIAENRPSIVAVLKKSAGLGAVPDVSQETIDDLAESFVLLCSYTGFPESEDQVNQQRPVSKVFTSFT